MTSNETQMPNGIQTSNEALASNTSIARWLMEMRKLRTYSDRPFVTLSYAQSLDGSIALHPGEPLPLSGDESLRVTHQLRSMHDGILVGIGTVLSDDPQLTVRHWSGANPQRIVLDTRLRLPTHARMRHAGEKPCWVLIGDSASENQQPWQGEGIETYCIQTSEDGRVCLRHALKFLHEKGIRHLMVEGGAQVITAFLRAKLVDAVVITLAPRFIGGYSAVGNLDAGAGGPSIDSLCGERIGKDFVVWGALIYDGAKA